MFNSSCLMNKEELLFHMICTKDSLQLGRKDTIRWEDVGLNMKHFKFLCGSEKSDRMRMMSEPLLWDIWLIVAERECSDLTKLGWDSPWDVFQKNKLAWTLKKNLNYSWVLIQCRNMVTKMPGSNLCLDRMIRFNRLLFYIFEYHKTIIKQTLIRLKFIFFTILITCGVFKNTIVNRY